MAALEDIILMFMPRTALDVWMMRYLSLSSCPWTMGLALYLACSVSGCSMAHMNITKRLSASHSILFFFEYKYASL